MTHNPKVPRGKDPGKLGATPGDKLRPGQGDTGTDVAGGEESLLLGNKDTEKNAGGGKYPHAREGAGKGSSETTPIDGQNLGKDEVPRADWMGDSEEGE